MSDILALVKNLIQTIDKVRTIENLNAATIDTKIPSHFSVVDSTYFLKRKLNGEDALKAGVFLIEECFSTINSSREKCLESNQHDNNKYIILCEKCLPSNQVDSSQFIVEIKSEPISLRHSDNKQCGFESFENRQKVDSMDCSFHAVEPRRNKDKDTSIIVQRFDNNPTFMCEASNQVYHNGSEENTESKYQHCGETEERAGKKTKENKYKTKHDRLLIAVNNRLNREKMKK